MATKLIPDLSATNSPLADGDLVVIEKADGSGTKKMTFAQLCQAVATKSYINNGTTSSDVPYKALDARMGKTLTDQVSTLNGRLFPAPNGNFTVDRMNSLKTPGIWGGYIALSKVITGGEGWGHIIVSTPATNYIVQTVAIATGVTATRRSSDNGSTWSVWAPPFKYQGVATTTVTAVGANTVSDTEIDCYLEGYKPIGITQWNIGSGGNHVSIVYVRIVNENSSNAKVRFRLINNSSTVVTPSDLSATVLYVKT